MHRASFRLPVLAAALVVAAGTVAACSSSHAPGPITLSFVSSDYGTAEQGLITAFEKANPDIKVKAVAEPATRMVQEVRASLNTTTPADVAQIDWTDMNQAYQSLPIIPVQKIAGTAWHAQTAAFDQSVLKATDFGGITVAMPYTMSVPTLLYNGNLFTAAGLDPSKPPTTMDQVAADATAITKHGGQGVYFDVADANKSDYLTQSVIDDNGGSVIAQNGVITLAQPPAVQALQELANLTTSGAQPGIGEAAAVTSFESGKLGMLVVSSGMLTTIAPAAKGKFRLLSGGFPAFAGKPVTPTYTGSGLVIMSHDPARARAAWQLVQFLTGERAATTLTTKLGYLPLRPDAVTDPKYLRKYFSTNPLLLPALHQLDSVTEYTVFHGPNAAQAVLALQDQAVTPISVQGRTAQPILSQVANTIVNLVGE